MTQNKLVEAETLLSKACASGEFPHESATIIRGTEWVRKSAATRAIREALSTAQAQEPVAWPLSARVRTRENEKLLEIEGTINGAFIICRHTQPIDTPDEDVPGLPTLYASPPAPSTPDAREIVEQFAADLERAAFDNVAFALNQSMCCNGHMCGCRGSTVGEYLAYELRDTLAIAALPLPTPSAPDAALREASVEAIAFVLANNDRNMASIPLAKLIIAALSNSGQMEKGA